MEEWWNECFKIFRKEEKFMSPINLFLQKRKMHENQHGIIMVVTAYVLSIAMLILGSDAFYNIKSMAAGVSLNADEEIVVSQVEEISVNQTGFMTEQMLQSSFNNPYGLEQSQEEIPTVTTKQGMEVSTDTVWLLGNAMSSEEFDTVLQQVNSSDIIIGKEPKDSNANIKSLSTKEKKQSDHISVSKSEREMLERIVEAEAGGEDIIGKILVANVIFNRIEDDHFPDTIKEVIFQNANGDYQFSPVKDERFWSVKISSESKKAVKRVLEGEDYSEGALYFIARKKSNTSNVKWFDNHLDWLFKHGGHEFYKNK